MCVDICVSFCAHQTGLSVLRKASHFAFTCLKCAVVLIKEEERAFVDKYVGVHLAQRDVAQNVANDSRGS